MKKTQLAAAVIAATTVSQEAIAFQGTHFFDVVTEAIGKIRNPKLDSKGRYDVSAADLPAIVKAYTNMSLTFFIDHSPLPNAYVMPASLAKDHIFNGRGAGGYHLNENIAAIKKLGGKAVGYVDRKTGKVHGHFTEIESFSAITHGLLTDNRYTDREIAAIYLHEVGHYFTFFEYLGKYLTMNMVLASATSSALDNEPYEVRATVLVEAAKALKLDVKEIPQLAQIPDAEQRAQAVQVVFMRKAAEEQQSGTGTFVYDQRICEQAADIFATRHGAGRDLATGMEKLERAYGNAHYSTFAFCAIEAVKLIALSGLTIVTGGSWLAVVAVMFFFANPSEKIYDDGTARIRLMRQQMIEELKLKDLPPERRRVLIEDVETVKEILNTMQDRRTLMQFLQTTILPWMRRDFKMEQLQKDLETLIANDLFVSAAKFKHGEKA